MKLIDILVEELPKRGGWPAEALFAMQDYDGLVKFSKSREKIYHDYSSGHQWCSEGGYDWITNGYPFEGCFKVRVAKDNETTFISREQYEPALAASKQAWNGEGLPPVGCECEIKRIADWMPVTIKFISDHHTVFTTFGGTEDCYQTCSLQFRPARSEADKKRDEAAKGLIEYLDKETDIDNVFSIQDVSGFYDAIAAGKIPGIRIE